MSTGFGTSSQDQSGQEENNTAPNGSEEGTNFGQAPGGETNTNGSEQGIDLEQYEALRKRDEHAQEHIQRLESENNELRDKIVELEDRLASATTLDEALKRISNQGEGQALDQTDVAQVVEQVLDQRITQDKQESNWQSVVSDLTQKYGKWNDADLAVQDRARELDISLDDATAMAKNNPKVFRQLFNLEENSTASATQPNPAGSHGAGAQGQRGVSSQPGPVRDKAYYSNLRKTDPNKYWSVDVQAQMRRDLYNK